MKIVIAGGTGFLGRPLTDALARDGHSIVVLTRGAATADRLTRRVTWRPDGSVGDWASELEGAGAVDQSGRRIDRRTTLVRRSEAANPRQPPPSHAEPARGDPARRGASSRSRQRVSRRLLRAARRSNRDRGHAAGHDFLAERLREVGSGSESGRKHSHARRLRSHRACASSATAAPSTNASAVLVRGGRTGWIGPSILAVDSSTGLDRSGAVRARDHGSPGP